MNPLGKVTGAITHPARTVGAVAGASVGVATAGLRTTARVVGWAVERAAGTATEAAPPVPREEAPAPDVRPADATPADTATEAAPAGPAKKAAAKAPATKAPAMKAAAKKAPAKKAPAKKAAAKKAPSKKAAVLAPALGLSEDEVDELRTPSGIPAAGEGHNPDTTETDLHQPGTEPLVDPATAKAVASEAGMLGRAADPDKG